MLINFDNRQIKVCLAEKDSFLTVYPDCYCDLSIAEYDISKEDLIKLKQALDFLFENGKLSVENKPVNS